MPELANLRTNLTYVKENNEYKKQFEIILLVVKPKYSLSKKNGIIKDREVIETRFTADEKTLDSLILALNEIKKSEEGNIK